MCAFRRLLHSLSVALVTMIVLSSCIGGTRLYTTELHLKAPTIDRDHPEIIEANDTTPALGIADVKTLWGPPAEIAVSADGSETWTYASPDHRWSGVVAALVVIALPLMVPVGHERVELTVRDGVVTDATVTLQDLGWAWFGLVWDDDRSVLRLGSVVKPSTLRADAARRILLPWCRPSSISDSVGDEARTDHTP